MKNLFLAIIECLCIVKIRSHQVYLVGGQKVTDATRISTNASHLEAVGEPQCNQLANIPRGPYHCNFIAWL